jgi:hypothetical protein
MILALTVFAACGPTSSAGGPDASMGSPDASGSNTPVCKPAVTSVASGHHNAGADCFQCHGGQGAPRFYAAGTAYTTATSSTPLVGATISVVDKAGVKVDLVTSSNGNFYTSTPLSYPLTVYASKCPTVMPMTGKVNAGGCNASGCHVAGTPHGRVHL